MSILIAPITSESLVSFNLTPVKPKNVSVVTVNLVGFVGLSPQLSTVYSVLYCSGILSANAKFMS